MKNKNSAPSFKLG